jgi:hypothetical protein
MYYRVEANDSDGACIVSSPEGMCLYEGKLVLSLICLYLHISKIYTKINIKRVINGQVGGHLSPLSPLSSSL